MFYLRVAPGWVALEPGARKVAYEPIKQEPSPWLAPGQTIKGLPRLCRLAAHGIVRYREPCQWPSLDLESKRYLILRHIHISEYVRAAHPFVKGKIVALA